MSIIFKISKYLHLFKQASFKGAMMKMFESLDANQEHAWKDRIEGDILNGILFSYFSIILSIIYLCSKWNASTWNYVFIKFILLSIFYN